MPRRKDIRRILILGSGPIVIGQACEFDYSGTQACKALRSEGFEVVLVNSNPASIMTDPETANRTYIEPLTALVVEQIFVIPGLGRTFVEAVIRDDFPLVLGLVTVISSSFIAINFIVDMFYSVIDPRVSRET